MTPEERRRVLLLALLGWGLGHLALGRRVLGMGLVAGEVAAVAILAGLATALADTTAYLVPFVAGAGFVVIWSWQAVAAYRAPGPLPANGPEPARSAAAAVAWLSLPLLLWGSGYWLIAAQAASPAAVVDRFVSDWADGRMEAAGWSASAVRAADGASALLSELCAQRRLDDCADADRFRDLRVRVTLLDERHATGVAEAVRFERRATRILGLFGGTEMKPVAVQRLLTMRLAAEPARGPWSEAIGALRWTLVDVVGPSPGA